MPALNLKAKRRLRAFTTIELMVAISIMGLLAAIALPAWNQYRVRMIAQQEANLVRSLISTTKELTLSSQNLHKIVYSPTDNTLVVSQQRYTTLSWNNTATSANYNVKTTWEELPRYTHKVDDSINLGNAAWTLTLGRRGWVQSVSGITKQSLNGVVYYNINVIAPGLNTIPVKVDVTGKAVMG